MKFKDILKLAEAKGYTPILCHVARFGGSATLPNEQIDKAEEISELALMQEFLRTNHRIFVTVTIHPYKPDQPAYCADCLSLSSKNMGERLLDGFTFFGSYNEAMSEGIFEALKLLSDGD